jgi:hypothetical protein
VTQPLPVQLPEQLNSSYSSIAGRNPSANIIMSPETSKLSSDPSQDATDLVVSDVGTAKTNGVDSTEEGKQDEAEGRIAPVPL